MSRGKHTQDQRRRIRRVANTTVAACQNLSAQMNCLSRSAARSLFRGIAERMFQRSRLCTVYTVQPIPGGDFLFFKGHPRLRKTLSVAISVAELSIDPLDRGIALCPPPLPQQPTGMPLAHFVLFACMLHRTTPPLRAQKFPEATSTRGHVD